VSDLLASEGLGAVPAFLTSLAIGLLVGVERERNPTAKAGLRTFALVALFGTLTALLSERAGSGLPLAAGLLLTGLGIIAAYRSAPEPTDPGTTTVAALLVVFALGAMSWYGERTVAVMLAVAVAALLYFKPELRGLLQRFERRDLLSVLQFAVLTFVVLPVLPDENFGPWGALNPYRIWLMVVLIAGISLAGYIALRLVGARHGAILLGFFGGLVSSTATTMVYSRHGREGRFVHVAAFVILVANLVVMVRVGAVTAVVEPRALPDVALVLGAALAAGAVGLVGFWWRTLRNEEALPVPEIANPTEMRTALTFGALYAAVLLATAWLAEVAGSRGLYLVAVVSGLTDVDALTLSTLRLFALDKVGSVQAATAIAIAIGANLAFKLGLVLSLGGRALARQVMLPASLVAAGGLGALLALHGTG
jgi:uncharacterized membrane protein (DUF4010 family)